MSTIFCVASQCISHCGSLNIWFPLPGDGDDSETPSAKKHPLPVAKGTLATSTIKSVNSTSIEGPMHVCDHALVTYVKLP